MVWEYAINTFPVIDPLTGKEVRGQTKEIEGIRIHLPPETVIWCREVDEKKSMDYWNKPPSKFQGGAYKGNGFIGNLGESAVGVLFDMTADLQHRKHGDGGKDFIIAGKRIDVKTARSSRLARNFIVRVQRGHKKDLQAEIYIGAYIEEEKALKDNVCNVILLGYIARDALVDRELRWSHVLHCWNTEIYFSELLDIRGLINHHERYLRRMKEACLTE